MQIHPCGGLDNIYVLLTLLLNYKQCLVSVMLLKNYLCLQSSLFLRLVQVYVIKVLYCAIQLNLAVVLSSCFQFKKLEMY